MPILPEQPRRRLSVQEELATQHKKIRFGKRLSLAKHEATIGELYHGWVYFEGKGKQKCAIKRIASSSDFAKVLKLSMQKKGLDPTIENIAKLYNSTIENLRNAEISLPKMKAVVHEGDLLIFSQYFGNARERKLSKYYMQDYSIEDLKELIDLWAKTINAGYFPTSDFVEKKKSGGFVPLDIDFLVLQKLFPKQTTKHNILFFCDWVRVYLSQDKRYVFETLLAKITNPKMHALFVEAIDIVN